MGVRESETSVLIVGAGPVGMTLVNLLGGYGIDCVLLERNTELYHLPRAVGLDDFALRVLQAAGPLERMWPDMVTDDGRGGPLRVRYQNARGRTFMEIAASGRPNGWPTLVGFEQPLVDQTLLEGLERFSHVQVHFGHEVTSIAQDDDGVTVRGCDTNGAGFGYRAQYVVACDGGRSFVRKALDVGFDGTTYTEKWLVIDTLEPDGPDRLVGDIRFWCDPRRPAMTFARKHRNRRWEFVQMPGETEEELLEPAKIRELLAHYTDPDHVEIIRTLVYTFHARQAKRWRVGRILLAGDAAHVMPPFAGQGMVNGVRDAGNLAWKLACVLRGQADANLLDTYERERRPIVEFATNMAIRLGRIMMPPTWWRAFVLEWSFRLGRLIPSVDRHFREARFRPDVPLTAGLILPGSDDTSRNGYMLPQPHVRTTAHDRVTLDDVLGPGFAVVGYGIDPESMLSPDARAHWDALGARLVHVLPPGSTPQPGTNAVEDVEGRLNRWLHGRTGRLLIVRPDRYAIADCTAAEFTNVTHAVATLMAAPKGTATVAAPQAAAAVSA